MKRFTPFCMALLMIAFMSMTLVACDGGSEARLDTATSRGFGKSFDLMYDSLKNSEKADLLYYFPLVLHTGAMAEELLKGLDRVKRSSDEVLLEQSPAIIAAYKKGCRALFELQAKSGEEVSGHNLKKLHGVTATEIIKKGKSILKAYHENG